MAELLFEIFSEEIPARMQRQAAADLGRLVGDGLKAQGLAATSIAAYGGPRRLALAADGVPAMQPDISDEKKGPRIDAPEQALQGFLRQSGLASLDQAEVRELDKGKFYFAVIRKKGRPATDVIKEVIEAALAQLPWPKSMRWASNPTRWVRPLHGLLCLFDGKVVAVSFAGLTASNTTRGHRFLAPAVIAVSGFADYKSKLKAAYVLVDPADRAKAISEGLVKLAAGEGLAVSDDHGLLDEVTGLAEWPVPLLGTIDAAFMDVPAEILTSSMRKHQKYFALKKPDGSLANRFGVIANMINADGGKEVVAGNEKVLRARLSDAKFFWDQDRGTRLDARVSKLAERVFQAKLGTVRDKVDRIGALAKTLAPSVPGADINHVARAALLCKADLSSDLVGEFPDLQGVMGRYFALNDKEPPAVAVAVAEHYSPLGPGDMCPTKPVSVAVSLADKLDSLVGFFAIDEKPTGSKDPFALRRAALGIIRLVLENRLRLRLLDVFKAAHAGLESRVTSDAKKVSGELLDFFADRLKAHLRDKGTRHDLVSAVFALGGEDDLIRLMARVAALKSFLESENGANLLVAYRRAANIVRIEQKKDKTSFGSVNLAGELGAPEADALFTHLEYVDRQAESALQREFFEQAMSLLASLRQPVDLFFDKVTVNADNPAHRKARLGLLTRIVSTMNRVADFGKIEG
ncbi:MAG: glycine--tRNA ligase subunit beta [Alphaproteobacteria bacterium]|nr:glycine--tRNA ligase subunit beta [Alphaproteobacteria bacterium]